MKDYTIGLLLFSCGSIKIRYTKVDLLKDFEHFIGLLDMLLLLNPKRCRQGDASNSLANAVPTRTSILKDTRTFEKSFSENGNYLRKILKKF